MSAELGIEFYEADAESQKLPILKIGEQVRAIDDGRLQRQWVRRQYSYVSKCYQNMFGLSQIRTGYVLPRLIKESDVSQFGLSIVGGWETKNG